MGKRKTREPEDSFQFSTQPFTTNYERLDKLRRDLWLTTTKQLKLVKLIRNEIPDCGDSDARNAIHRATELLKKHIDQVQETLDASWITASKFTKTAELRNS
ncbi:unnamed protein product [Peronospora destructor]|uniref:Uncharacterized protein n=1 Tax=Peronospora destructor TaxID=86335 RepID=A0AAV0UM54_9STRA|nr:unnamed protein product [Peronospora destructor]